MNQITANFLKGLFDGLNDKTAYRLGLWLNGLIAAACGALLGGGTNLLMQGMAGSGPMRWAAALEWAKGAAWSGVAMYFVSSPLQKVFKPDSIEVQASSVSTPNQQIETVHAVIKSDEPQS